MVASASLSTDRVIADPLRYSDDDVELACAAIERARFLHLAGRMAQVGWKMAREDALALDPEATPVEGTTEIRQLPTTQRERDDRLYRR